MTYLTSINQKANQVSPEEIVEKIILQRKDEIVDQVRTQWKNGVRPDGTIIGVYKSFAYNRMKLSQNPLAGGNVDLILDGSLNQNLTVNKLRGGLFSVFSTDEKAQSIASKYGLDVYGMNDEEEVMFLESVLNEALVFIFNSVYD